MRTRVWCEAAPDVGLLSGAPFTPTWQCGQKHERVDPLIDRNLHRFHRRREKVCWRADLGQLLFFQRLVQELGLGADAAFA
eukprot:4089621-Pleurochrysis_carterae.AAC.1